MPRSMPRWRTALAVALVAGGTVSAGAADLDYRDHGQRHPAYDDPRYADLYGPSSPPPRLERRYVDPYRPAPPPAYGYNHPPIPREPVYRDHAPYSPRRYADTPPGYRAYSSGPACLHRDEVRRELERDGWHDFRNPQVLDSGTAVLTARRQGRMFQLKVDRCSGDVLAARPIEGYRPYADYGSDRPYRAY